MRPHPPPQRGDGRRSRLRRVAPWLAALALVIGAIVATLDRPPPRERGRSTVEQRLRDHGPAVQTRMRAHFERAGLSWPPAQLAYVAFKDTRVLEVHARTAADQPWAHVTTYRVQGASGGPGPKLRSGDRQVPEGIYRASFLNPNSSHHVSIRLDYPNAFDRGMARAEGRSELGGDIMIHGGSSSIGCLAVGDEAAEDLFVMAALASKHHASKQAVRIIVSPTDFRRHGARTPDVAVPWAQQLYASLREELTQYRRGL